MSLFPTLLPIHAPPISTSIQRHQPGMSPSSCLSISAFASACKAFLPAPLQGWIHVTFRSPLCVISGWPRAPPLPKTALHRITLFIFFIVLNAFGYSFIYICMYCLFSSQKCSLHEDRVLLFPVPGAGPDKAVEQIQLSKCPPSHTTWAGNLIDYFCMKMT